MEMPLSGSTIPRAAWCRGLMDRSAALTSHTADGSNHTSGAPDSPYCRRDAENVPHASDRESLTRDMCVCGGGDEVA
jgi:hypothetical protein